MDKDELYANSVKLDFKEPDKYDWMTSLLVFGVCVYKSEVINGEVTVRFIPPYTKEFDEAMFTDDCNEDYIISDELINTKIMEEQEELWDELMMTIREWNREWNIFENKGKPPLTASELIREFKDRYILIKK